MKRKNLKAEQFSCFMYSLIIRSLVIRFSLACSLTHTYDWVSKKQMDNNSRYNAQSFLNHFLLFWVSQ